MGLGTLTAGLPLSSFVLPLSCRDRSRSQPCLGQGQGGSSQGTGLCFSLQTQTLRPESLLLVSTLDGSLHALSKQTGDLKWTLKDGEQGAHSLAPELEWCHCDIEDKAKGSRITQASVCGRLQHLVAVWPWESHSTSLSLSVPTRKMKAQVTAPPPGAPRRVTVHTCQVLGMGSGA